MKPIFFLLLVSIAAFSCRPRCDQPTRPPAAPIYHAAQINAVIDGQKVLIEVDMEAIEKWWDVPPYVEYQWWLNADYRIPKPFELRVKGNWESIKHYHWEDDFLEDRFKKNEGNQRYVTRTHPHRSRGKFWLINTETGNKVEVELPIWGYYRGE